MSATTFAMSVEYAPLQSRLEGDLPSDVTMARQVVEARYAAMLAAGEPVHTIAIMHKGDLFDLFDGREWSSDIGFDDEAGEPC
jgi:hypothetical protein